jgi:hypothetical protein
LTEKEIAALRDQMERRERTEREPFDPDGLPF